MQMFSRANHTSNGTHHMAEAISKVCQKQTILYM